jgi:hypothetical protein
MKHLLCLVTNGQRKRTVRHRYSLKQSEERTSDVASEGVS